MRTYKCVAVEDESLALDLLENHIQQIEELELIGKFQNPIEAKNFIDSNEVDLIFLDIEMPGMSGIDLIKSLSSNPQIVLITAYDEFALDGYELNVSDYVLKPLRFDRFQKAVNKVLNNLQTIDQLQNVHPSIENESVLIKSSHEIVKVNLADILYVEGLHKYVKIVTKKGKYTTLYGLSAFYEHLPKHLFFRCHRSFIVNKSKVLKISGGNAVLEDCSVPISKSQKQGFIEFLGKLL